MNEFYTFVKECLAIIVPAALAYIMWRQQQDSAKVEKIKGDVKTVKEDVQDVKAVGNSTLREAMVVAVQATKTTAAVTGTQTANVAAGVAQQRLEEHDEGQRKAAEAKDARIVDGQVILTTEHPEVTVKVVPPKDAAP